MSHTKIPGSVEAITSDGRWFARLWYEDGMYSAEMTAPLPQHARPGSLFTIHTTKAGDVYLHWITRPLITRRQLKTAHRQAREWMKVFDG